MITLAQLKEIQGVLAAIVGTATICILVGGALMEWRIGANVETKIDSMLGEYETLNALVDAKIQASIEAQDLGTDTKIVAMDTNIAANARTGVENAKDIAENKQAVRDAFKALMGTDAD